MKLSSAVIEAVRGAAIVSAVAVAGCGGATPRAAEPVPVAAVTAPVAVQRRPVAVSGRWNGNEVPPVQIVDPDLAVACGRG